MTNIDRDQLTTFLPTLLALAQNASDSIMNIYSTNFTINKKQDKSPVTTADIAAHEIINSGLQELTPLLPVLSEEAADISYAERSNWHTYWLIDPLDGTREFVKKSDEFTVNIALIENHQPILGIVQAPALGCTYYAIKNNGAYKYLNNDNPERIQVRTLSNGPIVVAGSKSHGNSLLNQYLAKLENYELISMGSALKACLVAEGKADIYPRLGLTSEWDTAAAQCIVEEAGGAMTTTNMEPMAYNKKESLLNPHFFVFGDASGNWSSYL